MSGKVRVESDGTTEGTRVFRSDGTEVAAGAYMVQVNVGGDQPAHVVITYLLGETTIEPVESEGGTIDSPVERHNRMKL